MTGVTSMELANLGVSGPSAPLERHTPAAQSEKLDTQFEVNGHRYKWNKQFKEFSEAAQVKYL